MPESTENEPRTYSNLREGLQVVGSDGQSVGTVHEVFRGVGDVETFGALGVAPQQPGHDPAKYGYSEGFPGPGDNYFTVRPDGGPVLYIPFGGIKNVEGDRVMLAVDADDVESMDWTVRPDVLAGMEDEYPTDSGANPKVA
jgi:hypothetical protein